MNTYEVSVKVVEPLGMDSGLLSSAFQRHKATLYHIETQASHTSEAMPLQSGDLELLLF